MPETPVSRAERVAPKSRPRSHLDRSLLGLIFLPRFTCDEASWAANGRRRNAVVGVAFAWAVALLVAFAVLSLVSVHLEGVWRETQKLLPSIAWSEDATAWARAGAGVWGALLMLLALSIPLPWYRRLVPSGEGTVTFLNWLNRMSGLTYLFLFGCAAIVVFALYQGHGVLPAKMIVASMRALGLAP
jgi:hypothetical protein